MSWLFSKKAAAEPVPAPAPRATDAAPHASAAAAARAAELSLARHEAAVLEKEVGYFTDMIAA